jgi:hypothetical protein
MSAPVFIPVSEIVGGRLCVATEDGDRVCEKIASALREGRRVILSFAEVDMVIPAFLSSAIGQLYGQFPEDQVDGLVECTDLPDNTQAAVVSSRRWAKAYYRDPAGYEKAVHEVLGE